MVRKLGKNISKLYRKLIERANYNFFVNFNRTKIFDKNDSELKKKTNGVEFQVQECVQSSLSKWIKCFISFNSFVIHTGKSHPLDLLNDLLLLIAFSLFLFDLESNSCYPNQSNQIKVISKIALGIEKSKSIDLLNLAKIS